jgi:hypothetical protein
MHLIANFKTLAQQETPAQRRRRMLPGAIYGLLIASAYTFISGIVNKLSFPDLPVGIDWRGLLPAWLFFAVWLGLGGMFINWFTQTEEGFGMSLFVMTLTALGIGAWNVDGDLTTQFGKLMLLILPVLAISFLTTIILRWLGVQSAAALEKERTTKIKPVITLTLIAIAIGGLAGFGLTRWDAPALSGIRDIHRRLQTSANNPSQVGTLFSLTDLPQLKSHLGKPYTLRGKPSGQLVGTAEVTATFEDDYRITCFLVVFPDRPPFLRTCAEGNQVILPGN